MQTNLQGQKANQRLLGMGNRREGLQRAMRKLLEVMDIFIIFIVVMA